MPDKPILTREALLNGNIARLVQSEPTDLPRMSDEQRTELVEQTLKTLGDRELWVFGYGSLIWNPAIDYEEQRRCTIHGFARKFCFWTSLSRGSKEFPGLMMGLVEGGSCTGLAFKINPESAATELDVLFRRELPHFIYKPTWVDAYCTERKTAFTALTFIVDIENPRFVENLTQAQTVATIAFAEGPLGKNCDYLFQLVQKLDELGFKEPNLELLARQVREFQSRNTET